MNVALSANPDLFFHFQTAFILMTDVPPGRENHSDDPPAYSPTEYQQPRTPPRTSASLNAPALHPSWFEDTPARARSVDEHAYRNGTLDEKRAAILSDLGQSIPEVDLDFFTNNVLPPLRDGFNVDEIVTSLESEEIIKGGRWKWFEEDPMRKESTETEAFKPVVDIFESIVRAANGKSHGHEQTLALRMAPNSIPVSERLNRTRPDGYMILKEAEDKFGSNEKARRSWYDLALTLEVKKDGTDPLERDDNVSKQIYSMQHTMSIDPCRRFAFGITIENANMRLWFCSRAVMLVTKAFNFIENYRMLIHIFLSFAFASKTELGWDPSMTVSIKNKVRVYHMEVGGEMYDTVEVLSDFGADAVIGRGTRAFRVVQRRTGTEYALKDVWVEDDRELEHKIYDDLLGDIGVNAGEEAKGIAKKYFMTPTQSCKVIVDGQEDHTCNVMMRGAVPSFDNTFELVIKKTSVDESAKSVAHSCASDIKEHLATRAPRDNTRKQIHQRIHYRLLFDEVAEPIHKVMDLRDVFIALRDCTIVLEYIHKAGWVHRDISCGNVYYYKGRGLLGDLEYAKRASSDAKHEVRTGTLDFMAVEVTRRYYNFLPIRDVDQVFGEAARVLAEQDSGQVDLGMGFCHNRFHDLESIWWIAVWMLFFHDDKSCPESDDSRRAIRKMQAQGLFPRDLNISDRHHCLLNEKAFKVMTNCLSPTFRKVIAALNAVRTALQRAYERAEATLPERIDMDGYVELVGRFRKGFDMCFKGATGIVLVPTCKSSSKRKATDAPSSTNDSSDPSPAPAPKAPRIGLHLRGHTPREERQT
ncbi:hypothetical protein M0805_002822 [Coniferiporia weirii]|nr:hypothetical protein M0805_002822 [Coniferiporia weirii]